MQYADYLESSAAHVSLLPTHLEPAHTTVSGTSAALKRIVRVRSDRLATRYSRLECALASKEVYHSPVDLLDFTPADRRSRYEYVHELVLPFPVEVYTYSHGNNLGTLIWIWKAPVNAALSDNHKSMQLVNEINRNISV